LFNPRFRVLCVDDDADACAMLSELLRLSGIQCQCADSAAEARTLIRAERFDLYLLDAWLPDMDGFEFCRQIRTIDSITPILFYSGAAYDSDKQQGIAAGANAYVVKPEVDNLVETMSRLVSEAREAETRLHSPVLRNLIEANRRAALTAPRTLGAGSF
jgi:two-component system, OmpR family, response regulator